MGIGSFLFLICDFVRAIGRCCCQPRILVANFAFLIPNRRACEQVRICGQDFGVWA